MINLFKRKKENETKSKPQLVDLDQNPLKEGDLVDSMRYELGRCRILKDDDGFWYESLKSGEKVSWLKMIDAATDCQKVKKVIS